MVGSEPVPSRLAGIHDVRQAGKHRIGEPMAAQIMPNPLDRVELWAVETLWGERRGEGTIVAVKKTDGVPHAAAE